MRDYLSRSKQVIIVMYSKLCNAFFSLCTTISPTLTTKLRYRQVFGKKLNLNQPKSLSEKLLWIKVNYYNESELIAKCADKYLVRDYVEQCGLSHILNELIHTYNSANEIQWDELPNKFVLKWNFGAGMNIVCKDKTKLDYDCTVKQLNKWGKVKYWLPYAEMQYKGIKKKIVCERFLQNDSQDGVIPDYKVYCFHGAPLAILVMHDRGGKVKAEFFDRNWDDLAPPVGKYEKVRIRTSKPACFDEMLDASEILSKPFPFVRCDFYVVNGQLYFGELTFTPAGGLYLSQTTIDGRDMADYLNVP